MAFFIDRAIEVGRFPFDFHVYFIKPPASAHRALAAAELFFNLGAYLITHRLSVE